MNDQRLRADLEHDEGKRRYAYDDKTGERVKAPVGHLSIGIGTNLDEGLSDAEVTALYETRLSVAVRAASAFLPPGGWPTLDEIRQEVLVQMAFQLGESRLRKFVKLRRAIIMQHWEVAAGEMLASLWHQQSPARAARLAERMRTGTHERSHDP